MAATILLIAFVANILSAGEAGFCQQSVTCYKKCYTRARYTTGCGLFGWARCTEYRSTSKQCVDTMPCYEQVCCPGYTGTNCDQALCDGFRYCPNNGICAYPDHCICPSGFASPRCTDIDECTSWNNRCSQRCINTHGSYSCYCNAGYYLETDGVTCTDTDECAFNNGGCQHVCENVPASHRCSCLPGFSINSDGTTCSDIDDCAALSPPCEQICTNAPGSYACACVDGYHLATDRTSCEEDCSVCDQICTNDVCSCYPGYLLHEDGTTCNDIDECATNSGGCSYQCTNLKGTYRCDCPVGNRLDQEGTGCIDIDECADRTSGCDQVCNNTDGSYTCSCNIGYRLASDGHSCENINDCQGVECHNNGTCADGINTYKCVCSPGYTGQHCGSDIDECSYLNGGCQETCTNTEGSYNCSCPGNTTLADNGFSCTDGSGSSETHETSIPRGDYLVQVTSAPDQQSLTLSSTSRWHRLQTDPNIHFTSGIVFVESDTGALPVSLTGLEISNATNKFMVISKSTSYSETDGVALSVTRSAHATEQDVTSSDIQSYVMTGSFMYTYLEQLNEILPNWLTFKKSSSSAISVSNIGSDIKYGSEVGIIEECRGAPVFGDLLYNVFIFDTSLILSIYSDDTEFSKPKVGNKLCIVTDIFNSGGGTVFVLVPEESRDAVAALPILQNLHDSQKITIRPRGLGFSLSRGISVHSHTSSVELWNGDHMFQYPVSPRANVWLDAVCEKESDNIRVRLDTSLFITMPNPFDLLFGVYQDQWDLLLDIKDNSVITLKFDLLGVHHEMDIAEIDLDTYMSVGGSDDRSFCGPEANPPGIFTSAVVNLRPFNVPILNGIVFKNRLHVFLASGHYLSNQNDVIKSLVETMEDRLEKLAALLLDSWDEVEMHVTSDTKSLFNNILASISSLKDRLTVQKSAVTVSPANTIRGTWNSWTLIKNDLLNVSNVLKNQFEQTTKAFRNMIETEIRAVSSAISSAIWHTSNALMDALESNAGWGLRYEGSVEAKIVVSLFDVPFPSIELVHSIDRLGSCSRFHKVYALMANEDAVRFLLDADVSMLQIRLGPFLELENAGIGFAFASKSDKWIFQLFCTVDIFGLTEILGTGLKARADVFLSNKGLYLYVEGSIFDSFYVLLDISAELGDNDWYKMTLKISGLFVVRMVGSGDETVQNQKSLSHSYLDGLKQGLANIANQANKRIEDVQKLVKKAQKAFTAAQIWLEEKKADIRSAQQKYDAAIASMSQAEQYLEEAKAPFKRAIDALSEAQRKIDRLCKIDRCGKICIPFLNCKWRWWGLSCWWDKCRWSITNPLCIAKNLVCMAIRAVAYVALEVAKAAVRIPMLILDVAKKAVWLAQTVLSKARVVFNLAEGVMSLAQFGLEAAKVVLDGANLALEGVKFVVRAALEVLNFIITNGLQRLIDVRNCGFYLEIRTVSLPIFDVSCEINPLQLGWREVRFRMNFNNPLQSLWQAAKATVELILGIIKDIFGRKKRDITYEYMNKMHPLLRKIRQVSLNGNGTDPSAFNSTVNNGNDTSTIAGNATAESVDYDDRVLAFAAKCETFQNVISFLRNGTDTLFTSVNESKTIIDEAQIKLNELNSSTMTTVENIDLSSSGVDPDVAFSEYNITAEELNAIIANMTASFGQNEIMQELTEANNLAKTHLQQQMNAIENIDHVNLWLATMENVTLTYFNSSQCYGFLDCVQFALTELYALYINEENIPEINRIQEAVMSLDDIYLALINDTTYSIEILYNYSISLSAHLDTLDDLNVFCHNAPVVVEPFGNLTALLGEDIVIHSNVTGDPVLTFWWYKDGQLIGGEGSDQLVVTNVSVEDVGWYKYKVGNIVANISSDEGYLSIIEQCPPGSRTDAGLCISCELGTYQPDGGKTSCIQCPAGISTSTTGSDDITQCSVLCDTGSIEINGVCTMCEAGTFQNDSAQTSCYTCPSGLTTAGEGAKDLSECSVTCAAGTYLVDGRCRDCDVGFYQPDSGATNCIRCPDWLTTTGMGASSISQCVANCSAGTVYNGTMCVPCPVGTYQPWVGQSACAQCPTGYTTDGDGASVERQCSVQCLPGMRLISGSCQECELGFYQDESGQIECKPCPGPYSTDTPGALDSSECSVYDPGLEVSDDVPSQQPAESSANNEHEDATNVALIVGLSVAGVCLVGIATLVTILIWKKTARHAVRDNTSRKHSVASLSMVSPVVLPNLGAEPAKPVFNPRRLSWTGHATPDFGTQPTNKMFNARRMSWTDPTEVTE